MKMVVTCGSLRRGVAVVACVAGLGGVVRGDGGALTTGQEARVREGIEVFDAAARGDAAALAEAVAIFEGVLAEQPEHPVVLAYLGCATSMQAQAAPLWRKPGLGSRGFHMLDRAVELAPGDLHVRLIRGLNGVHAPGFLGRRGLAEGDLALVRGAALDAESGMTDELRRLALYHLGVLAAEGGSAEAVELLEGALAVAAARPSTEVIEVALEAARKLALGASDGPPSRS